MGYARTELRIRLRVDRHGGDKQDRDAALVQLLERRIGELVDLPEYEHLMAEVDTLDG